jgi:membrane protein implicated in regulation of membrane protease activity
VCVDLGRRRQLQDLHSREDQQPGADGNETEAHRTDPEVAADADEKEDAGEDDGRADVLVRRVCVVLNSQPMWRWSSEAGDRLARASDDNPSVILLAVILVVVFLSVPSPWNVLLLVAACILEVGEIVFLRRWAKRLDRRTKSTTGEEGMIGQAAEVVEACRPDGTVHVHGELWRAHCEAGADAGQTVHIEAVDGLTLLVAPAS